MTRCLVLWRFGKTLYFNPERKKTSWSHCPQQLKIELQKVENDILQVAVKAELRNCYEATQEDLAYVVEEFTTFAKNQELKAALLNSADLLNQGDFDGIRGLIERAMRAGMDKNMGHEYNKDVESRYRENYRPTIPTP